MPDTRPLEQLRARLAATLARETVFRPNVWTGVAPREANEVFREVREAFGEQSVRPDGRSILDSLRQFEARRDVGSFNELKYVCYGASVEAAAAGMSLLQKPQLLRRLFELVEARTANLRQFRRCYQGLLDAYFTAERPEHKAPSGAADRPSEPLREFLDRHFDFVFNGSERKGRVPEWLRVLAKHRNLLGGDPCERYARGLERQDVSELDEACSGLGISRSSWVWDEAILSYVRQVTAMADAPFKGALSSALDLVAGSERLRLSQRMKGAVIRELINRYGLSEDRSEHPRLRDTAVEVLGNPWLQKAQWDAQGVADDARQMIVSWLKQRLIRDFFELLAHEGRADVRRLNYWLKFEPLIEDMWFALGPDAQMNRSAEFRELRRRMVGRERFLENAGQASNNAFIMRIGHFVVVEFGITGNACFVFRDADFNVDLDRPEVSLVRLKQRRRSVAWLVHNAQWEYRFDSELERLMPGITRSSGSPGTHGRARGTPAGPGAPGPKAAREIHRGTRVDQIVAICRLQNIEFEDFRDRGGSLWAYVDPDKNPAVGKWLESLGMRHKPGRGYWLSD